MVYENLTKTILEIGGTIKPLLIDSKDSGGTGLCNASLLYNDGKLRMILRNVEYTLHCSEGEQLYQSRYEGPVSYYHRDDDLKLRTNNFYCELDETTLEIKKYSKIDTSKLEKTPIWVFIGLIVSKRKKPYILSLIIGLGLLSILLLFAQIFGANLEVK